MKRSKPTRQARRRQYNKAGAFKLTEFVNPSGETVYRVTGYRLDGSRIRENFKDHSAAIARKQQIEIAEQNIATAAKPVLTSLTQEQVDTATRAFADLGDYPMSLAIRFFLDNYREPVQEITLKRALDEFIAERTRANDRPLTIRNLSQRVGGIVDAQPDKILSTVLEGEIKAAVFKPGRGPVAQDNDRRAYLQFFNWAKARGYCAANPVAGIEPIKIDRDEPQILPLEKVRALIDAAATYKDGVALPYVALGLFAAIRPTELGRMTWSAIDLEEGLITLGGQLTKMRARRLVEMARLTERDAQGDERKLPSNLAEWLAPHAIKRTPIKGKNWRRDMDKVKELAGLIRYEKIKGKERKRMVPACWIQDILRHTGISYHLALFKHEGQTATWAGNSPDIIQRHYKGLVKPAEALQFWAIRPADVAAKVIPMPAAPPAA